MVPRENKNNAYAKFWWTNKGYYGIFERNLSSGAQVVRTISKQVISRRSLDENGCEMRKNEKHVQSVQHIFFSR